MQGGSSSEGSLRRLIASYTDDLVLLIQQLDLSNRDAVNHVCIRLESLYTDLIEADLSGYMYIHPQVIQKVFECWKLFQDDDDYAIRGRPSIEISPSVLKCLVDLQFTSSDISLILGVSRSTVCRRMRQQGLSHTGNYCCINDANLDEIVKAVSAQHPDCGSKMMNGHLRAQGIIVQQIRIRESLRRTDPD